MRKFWNSIKDYVFIVLIVILIRSFIVTPAKVDGSSMDSTLRDGQIILINKIGYRLSDIKRFDIVVLKNRKDNDKIIKRIIALPNETIEYKDDILYINGKKMLTMPFEHTENFKATTGDGEYFVLGDNRDISKDSRYLGNFKRKDIIGKANFRLLPLNKFGIIEK